MWFQKYHRPRSFSPPHQRPGTSRDPSDLSAPCPMDTSAEAGDGAADAQPALLRPPKASLLDFMPRQIQAKNKRRPAAKEVSAGLNENGPVNSPTGISALDEPLPHAAKGSSVGPNNNAAISCIPMPAASAPTASMALPDATGPDVYGDQSSAQESAHVRAASGPAEAPTPQSASQSTAHTEPAQRLAESMDAGANSRSANGLQDQASLGQPGQSSAGPVPVQMPRPSVRSWADVLGRKPNLEAQPFASSNHHAAAEKHIEAQKVPAASDTPIMHSASRASAACPDDAAPSSAHVPVSTPPTGDSVPADAERVSQIQTDDAAGTSRPQPLQSQHDNGSPVDFEPISEPLNEKQDVADEEKTLLSQGSQHPAERPGQEQIIGQATSSPTDPLTHAQGSVIGGQTADLHRQHADGPGRSPGQQQQQQEESRLSAADANSAGTARLREAGSLQQQHAGGLDRNQQQQLPPQLPQLSQSLAPADALAASPPALNPLDPTSTASMLAGDQQSMGESQMKMHAFSQGSHVAANNPFAHVPNGLPVDMTVRTSSSASKPYDASAAQQILHQASQSGGFRPGLSLNSAAYSQKSFSNGKLPAGPDPYAARATSSQGAPPVREPAPSRPSPAFADRNQEFSPFEPFSSSQRLHQSRGQDLKPCAHSAGRQASSPFEPFSSSQPMRQGPGPAPPGRLSVRESMVPGFSAPCQGPSPFEPFSSSQRIQQSPGQVPTGRLPVGKSMALGVSAQHQASSPFEPFSSSQRMQQGPGQAPTGMLRMGDSVASAFVSQSQVLSPYEAFSSSQPIQQRPGEAVPQTPTGMLLTGESMAPAFVSQSQVSSPYEPFRSQQVQQQLPMQAPRSVQHAWAHRPLGPRSLHQPASFVPAFPNVAAHSSRSAWASGYQQPMPGNMPMRSQPHSNGQGELPQPADRRPPGVNILVMTGRSREFMYAQPVHQSVYPPGVSTSAVTGRGREPMYAQSVHQSAHRDWPQTSGVMLTPSPANPPSINYILERMAADLPANVGRLDQHLRHSQALGSQQQVPQAPTHDNSSAMHNASSARLHAQQFPQSQYVCMPDAYQQDVPGPSHIRQPPWSHHAGPSGMPSISHLDHSSQAAALHALQSRESSHTQSSRSSPSRSHSHISQHSLKAGSEWERSTAESASFHQQVLHQNKPGKMRPDHQHEHNQTIHLQQQQQQQPFHRNQRSNPDVPCQAPFMEPGTLPSDGNEPHESASYVQADWPPPSQQLSHPHLSPSPQQQQQRQNGALNTSLNQHPGAWKLPNAEAGPSWVPGRRLDTAVKFPQQPYGEEQLVQRSHGV